MNNKLYATTQLNGCWPKWGEQVGMVRIYFVAYHFFINELMIDEFEFG